jgi:hypothetical protein
MITTEPMRFAGILQREFLPQKRRLPVSYTPGTEHFHHVTPFVAMGSFTSGAQESHQRESAKKYSMFSIGSFDRTGQVSSVEAVNMVAFRQ